MTTADLHRYQQPRSAASHAATIASARQHPHELDGYVAVTGRRSVAEKIAIGTELFIAGWAYAAGLGMLANPREGLGFPPQMIDGVWFVSTWTVPGLALIAVNGLWPTAVAVAALRRHPLAPLGHLGVPVTISIWLGVQIAMIGWWPGLQIGTFALGALAGTAGWIAARERGGVGTVVARPARDHWHNSGLRRRLVALGRERAPDGAAAHAGSPVSESAS